MNKPWFIVEMPHRFDIIQNGRMTDKLCSHSACLHRESKQ
ncbi:hypothetical protein D042_0372 [Vibrio parahaemolyticus NIHCB0757]|nr:hypothetical protein D042_0372 [Vibrio parahaemolyticus NIHCB0757]